MYFLIKKLIKVLKNVGNVMSVVLLIRIDEQVALFKESKRLEE